MQNSEALETVLRAGIRELRIPAEASPAGNSGLRVERHPFSECFFCTAGVCEYFLNGEALTLSPGAFCWIRSWIPHQYGFRPSCDDWCEQLWFSVHSGEIRYGLFRSREDGLFLARSPQGVLPGEYAVLFHRLAEEWETRMDEFRMRRFFELALAEIAARLRHPGDDGGSREEGIAGALKSCIRTRNGANCSLVELERIFGYSRSHLSHLFRAETGISIGEYIRQIRLEYTERALRRGMKHKEIAAELGFSSPAAFWLWRDRRRRREQRERGE